MTGFWHWLWEGIHNKEFHFLLKLIGCLFGCSFLLIPSIVLAAQCHPIFILGVIPATLLLLYTIYLMENDP